MENNLPRQYGDINDISQPYFKGTNSIEYHQIPVFDQIDPEIIVIKIVIENFQKILSWRPVVFSKNSKYR